MFKKPKPDSIYEKIAQNNIDDESFLGIKDGLEEVTSGEHYAMLEGKQIILAVAKDLGYSCKVKHSRLNP